MRYFLEFLVMVAILAVVGYYDEIKHLTFNIDLKENLLVKLAILAASIIALVIAIRLFLLPYFIARDRNHRNKIPILLTTLFFGWGLVGWLVAIIWSTTCNVEENKKKEAKNSHPIPTGTFEPAVYTLAEQKNKTRLMTAQK